VGRDAAFFAKGCSDAIVAFIGLNLTISVPKRSDKVIYPFLASVLGFLIANFFQLEIELEIGTNDSKLAPFSVDSLIFEVVRSRIQQRDTVLDLSSFHRNPGIFFMLILMSRDLNFFFADLINHCFCSMRFQKHLKNVLQFAKLLTKDCISSVNLSGNDLSDLNCLNSIMSTFGKAKRLDLRKNKVSNKNIKNNGVSLAFH
jgi:hypothetical protein